MTSSYFSRKSSIFGVKNSSRTLEISRSFQIHFFNIQQRKDSNHGWEIIETGATNIQKHGHRNETEPQTRIRIPKIKSLVI